MKFRKSLGLFVCVLILLSFLASVSFLVLPQEVLDKGVNVIVTGPNPLVFLAFLLYPVEAGIVMFRPSVLLFPFNEKEKT